jgi:hypothetical protein
MMYYRNAQVVLLRFPITAPVNCRLLESALILQLIALALSSSAFVLMPIKSVTILQVIAHLSSDWQITLL